MSNHPKLWVRECLLYSCGTSAKETLVTKMGEGMSWHQDQMHPRTRTMSASIVLITKARWPNGNSRERDTLYITLHKLFRQTNICICSVNGNREPANHPTRPTLWQTYWATLKNRIRSFLHEDMTTINYLLWCLNENTPLHNESLGCGRLSER